MARKHVAPHAKRLQKRAERHRKKVWATFKKLARHKGCYAAPKGGMLMYGMGFKGKHPQKGKGKKGGMYLYGMGFRKIKKKVIKLPAWVNKPVPKSGWPKVPAGFSKSGGWFWNKHKAKAQKVQKAAKSYLSRIWAKGKETVGKVGSAAAATVKSHAKQLADQGMKFLSDHQDQFVDMADKFVSAQADKYAAKASSTMDKYAAKPKKGSGVSASERAHLDRMNALRKTMPKGVATW